MEIRNFKELRSTSDELRQMVDRGEVTDPLTAIRADFQTRGRGQVGNGWESEPGSNLLISVYVRPREVSVDRQFIISMAVSLAVVDTVRGVLPRRLWPALKIKWPNDIYVGERKLSGILIENRLCGRAISDSIIGVGLNVNQLAFHSDAPNPVSIRQLTGRAEGIGAMARSLVTSISAWMTLVDSAEDAIVMRDYWAALFRADGMCHDFADGNGRFTARIDSVAPDGRLSLALPGGETRSYLFKEVEHVILLKDGSEVTPNL